MRVARPRRTRNYSLKALLKKIKPRNLHGEIKMGKPVGGEEKHPLVRVLARGEREIRAKKGRDLDKVLAEADRLLARTPRPRR